MQTRIEPGKFARYSFDSLSELGEYIARTPRTWTIDASEKNKSSEDWDLNAGYAASVEMARNGWLEGAEKIQEALKAFTPMTPQPDCKVDFYGFRPHVPRFCAGAPDNMIRHDYTPTMGCGRVLTLIVPVTIQCYVDARCASNFGVAVAQYVNQLETQGTRVELIGCLASDYEYQNPRSFQVSHTWTIKRADQPLDLAVVAFSIGHPAMFRRLGFALNERSEAKTSRCHMYPRDARMSDIINPPPGAVILNGMRDANTHAPTPEKALAYVEAQINKAMEDL